ncbi:aminotransferase class I/II-fold pyridoxal phosphate-dependent enzyme [Altererythrobacter soli]|uniref:Aminotransferase class I/II-fold pyridoxal phosphate-dependent enzyme n=1 Tax=Croceibacterium soli TaxID=1739690 RepID=A0A6I4UUW8_9SPHN|nr:pyridoxal phosphate-dependent aminotransferase [Croceibacterium soli]MXP41303.1 aminotransferase class I/II-fold pyridoxal phosphate-dependent enzyme [Croceibacterium soli]
MDLAPFLLDQWLTEYGFRTPPVRYNLASSCGPHWTLAELQQLPVGTLDLGAIAIDYAPPDGARALREAIAARHCVDPDWVIVTTGASEALSILFYLASKPGGDVVLPDPGYPAFAAYGEAWGLRASTYTPGRGSGFRVSADQVLAATSGDTVLALVNTPHNPTGAVCPRAEIEQIAGSLAEKGIPLVVDQVFHPLYFGEAQGSAAGIDNTIVVGDMSKAMSLAGLRVGWIIDADAGRRERIVNARSYSTVSGSPLTEALAAHALNNAETVLARLASTTSANLSLLDGVMAIAAGILSWVRPEGGTIAYPWFVDGRDSRPFCEALAEAGVLVVPGDCFGAPEHMRIGFGAQSVGFETAAGILCAALQRG